MAIQYIDNDNPDGAVFGQDSSSLIAFWGATPAAQASATAAAGTTASTTTSPAGCATTTQMTALINLVDGIRSRLITLGLWGA